MTVSRSSRRKAKRNSSVRFLCETDIYDVIRPWRVLREKLQDANPEAIEDGFCIFLEDVPQLIRHIRAKHYVREFSHYQGYGTDIIFCVGCSNVITRWTVSENGRKIVIKKREFPFALKRMLYISESRVYVGITNENAVVLLAKSRGVIKDVCFVGCIYNAQSMTYIKKNKCLVVAGVGLLKYWTIVGVEHSAFVEGGEIIKTTIAETEWVMQLVVEAFSDRLLVVTETGITIINYLTMTQVGVLKDRVLGFVTCCCVYRKNEYLITGDRYASIRVWNTSLNAQVTVFTGHRKKITALQCHRNEPLLFTASEDGVVIIWRMDLLRMYKQVKVGNTVLKMSATNNLGPVGFWCQTPGNEIRFYELNEFYSNFTILESSICKMQRLFGLGEHPNRIMVATDDGGMRVLNPVNAVCIGLMFPIISLKVMDKYVYNSYTQRMYMILPNGNVLTLSCRKSPFRALELFVPSVPEETVMCATAMHLGVGYTHNEIDDLVIFIGLQSGQIGLLVSKSFFMTSYLQAHHGSVVHLEVLAEAHSKGEILQRFSRVLFSSGTDMQIKCWKLKCHPIEGEGLEIKFDLIQTIRLTFMVKQMSAANHRICIIYNESFVVHMFDISPVESRTDAKFFTSTPITHSSDYDHVQKVNGLDKCALLNIFATGSADGTIKIWDSDCQLIRELIFVEPIIDLCFATDIGDLLIARDVTIVVSSPDKYLPWRYLEKMLKKKYKEDAREPPMDYKEAKRSWINPSQVPSRPFPRYNLSRHRDEVVSSQDAQLWHLAWDIGGGRRDILSVPVIHRTGRESFFHGLVEMLIDANNRRMNIELPKHVETTQKTKTPSLKDAILQHLGTVGQDMGIIDVREADSSYSLDVGTLLLQPQASQESLSQDRSIDSEESLPDLEQSDSELAIMDDSKISSRKAGVAVKTIVDIPSSEADKFKSTETRESLSTTVTKIVVTKFDEIPEAIVREIPSVTKRGELPSTGILEIPKRKTAGIPSKKAEEIPSPSAGKTPLVGEGKVKDEHAIQDKIQPSKTGLPPEVSVPLPETLNPQAVKIHVTPPKIVTTEDSTIGDLSKKKVRIDSKTKLGSQKSDDVRQSTGACQESVRPDPCREDKRTEGSTDGMSLSLTLTTEKVAGARFTTRKRSSQPGVSLDTLVSLQRLSSSETPMKPTVANRIAFAVKQFKTALIHKETSQESSDLCSLDDSGKQTISQKVQEVQTRDRKAKTVTIMNKESSLDIKATKKDFERVCKEPEDDSVDPITAMLAAMEIPSKFDILRTMPKKKEGKQSKVTRETSGSSSSGSDEDEAIDLESDSTSVTQTAISVETNVTQFSIADTRSKKRKISTIKLSKPKSPTVKEVLNERGTVSRMTKTRSKQILDICHERDHISGGPLTRMPKATGSHEIQEVPERKDTIIERSIPSTGLYEIEDYITPEQMKSFEKRLKIPTIPNSRFRRRPLLVPPSPPTWLDHLQEKVLSAVDDVIDIQKGVRKKLSRVVPTIDNQPFDEEALNESVDWVAFRRRLFPILTNKVETLIDVTKKMTPKTPKVTTIPEEKVTKTKTKPPPRQPPPAASKQTRTRPETPTEQPPPVKKISSAMPVSKSSVTVRKRTQSTGRKISAYHTKSMEKLTDVMDPLSRLHRELWFPKGVQLDPTITYETLLGVLKEQHSPDEIVQACGYTVDLQSTYDIPGPLIRQTASTMIDLLSHEDEAVKVTCLATIPQLAPLSKKLLKAVLENLVDSAETVRHEALTTMKRYGIDTKSDMIHTLIEYNVFNPYDGNANEVQALGIVKAKKKTLQTQGQTFFGPKIERYEPSVIQAPRVRGIPAENIPLPYKSEMSADMIPVVQTQNETPKVVYKWQDKTRKSIEDIFDFSKSSQKSVNVTRAQSGQEKNRSPHWSQSLETSHELPFSPEMSRMAPHHSYSLQTRHVLPSQPGKAICVPSPQPQASEWSPLPPSQPQASEWSPLPPSQPQASEWSPLPTSQSQASEWSPLPPSQPQAAEWSPLSPSQPQASEWSPLPPSQPQASEWSPLPSSQPAKPEMRHLPPSQTQSSEQIRLPPSQSEKSKLIRLPKTQRPETSRLPPSQPQASEWSPLPPSQSQASEWSPLPSSQPAKPEMRHLPPSQTQSSEQVRLPPSQSEKTKLIHLPKSQRPETSHLPPSQPQTSATSSLPTCQPQSSETSHLPPYEPQSPEPSHDQLSQPLSQALNHTLPCQSLSSDSKQGPPYQLPSYDVSTLSTFQPPDDDNGEWPMSHQSENQLPQGVDWVSYHRPDQIRSSGEQLDDVGELSSTSRKQPALQTLRHLPFLRSTSTRRRSMRRRKHYKFWHSLFLWLPGENGIRLLRDIHVEHSVSQHLQPSPPTRIKPLCGRFGMHTEVLETGTSNFGCLRMNWTTRVPAVPVEGMLQRIQLLSKLRFPDIHHELRHKKNESSSSLNVGYIPSQPLKPCGGFIVNGKSERTPSQWSKRSKSRLPLRSTRYLQPLKPLPSVLRYSSFAMYPRSCKRAVLKRLHQPNYC